ncbi:Gp138 family membrane-puncturing spike protein [Paenibacillus sp. RC84]|uniref:Gp138 family membrane-puncturing spike protein n=1 Tax=Paenibacillus sp. RC84 TaxID=3156252 RepID=UPI0035153535
MSIDASGSLGQLLRSLADKIMTDLSVSFPCRVESFDSGTGMATVQPLTRLGDAPPALITNVPALGQRLTINGAEQICRPALKRGDTVLVVCADRQIKNSLAGQIAKPDSPRMHDHNDAVIVGVFPCSL